MRRLPPWCLPSWCLPLWCLWLLGCAPHTMVADPSNRAALLQEPTITAGVTQVDITPPAGLSLWGHGPESRIATGRLTRLRCQIFVLVGAYTGSGNVKPDAVALVTCDMAWPSLVVQRQIAKRVAVASRGRVPLGADRIWLMATHTHAGAGHMWPWESYVGPLSSRLRGFDMDVVNLVAERVGNGVIEAYENRCEARVAWGHEQLYGLGYTRSLQAFFQNTERPGLLEKETKNSTTNLPLTPAEQATDRQLSVLRIDCLDGGSRSPKGVLAVYGVHPAVVANDNQLYHGDLFGFASHTAADLIGSGVVVGIANGIAGDVAPLKQLAAPRESRRLGEQLGGSVHELWRDLDGQVAKPESGQATVTAAYQDLHLPKAPTTVGTLCERPMLGAAAGGGAEDNPTKLRIIMYNNPGVRRRHPGGCHQEKLGVQAVWGHFEGGCHFPATVPIGVAKIGNGIIATLPAEPTTVAGLRIREAIAQVANLPLAQVVLASLTGGYVQYVATEEEYPLQLYEGASTLYGPQSARFFLEQHQCLARATFRGDANACCAKPCTIDEPFPVTYPRGGEERLICQGSAEDNRDRVQCPLFDMPWVGEIAAAPSEVLTRDGVLAYEVQWPGEPMAQGTVRAHPLVTVHVERVSDKTVIDSDAGTRISVRAFPQWPGQWAAVWRPRLPKRIYEAGTPDFRNPTYQAEAQRLGCGQHHRFVVTGATQHESSPFRLRCDEELSEVDLVEGTQRMRSAP